MRIGIVGPSIDRLGWDSWIELIESADDLGVDAVLLRHGEGADPLVLAAAISSRSRHLRVAVEIVASIRQHPLHLAERIAVTDQCLGGRLQVVLRRSNEAGGSEHLSETFEIIASALSSNPFAYNGKHWKVPAKLPANGMDNQRQVTMTPPPYQLVVPIWTVGSELLVFARDRDLIWLGDSMHALFLPHPGEERSSTARLVPRLYDWPEESGGIKPLVEQLKSDSLDHGVNLGFLPLPGDSRVALETLMKKVRPRVQLSNLPAGLTDFWDEILN